jgi:hypothetical protein
MKYLAILFFVVIMFVSCGKGGGEDISPCHDLVPTEQDSNQ